MIAFAQRLVRQILGFDPPIDESQRCFAAAMIFKLTATDGQIVLGLRSSYDCLLPDEWDDAWRQVLEDELRTRGWSDEQVQAVQP